MGNSKIPTHSIITFYNNLYYLVAPKENWLKDFLQVTLAAKIKRSTTILLINIQNEVVISHSSIL